MPALIVGVLGFFVLLSFVVGVTAAINYTLFIAGAPKPELMPEGVSLYLSIVNGLLVTHLGAYLGLKVIVAALNPPVPIHWLQVLAASVYVVLLVVAFGFWWIADFTIDPERIVPIIPEMSRSGIGIVIAVLSAALGIQSAKIRHLLTGRV